MIFDSSASGSDNMHTMQQEIGTVQTLDESPPIFTRLQIPDPTAVNNQIVVTFKLNEALHWCFAAASLRVRHVERSDSAEPTLHINQILSADFSQEIFDPVNDVGTITITSLEARDPSSVLYEASQYDVYCWAKDSAVDTHGFARPNYMSQSTVETAVGADVNNPSGGLTENVWITDTTPPTIIVVSREALGESHIQVTLQLNEPGTVWCQVADQDGSPTGTRYCQNSAIDFLTSSDPCYYETWIQGVNRGGSDSTVFMEEVHVPYQDFDIDMTRIEKVTATVAGEAMVGNYFYYVWCFAQDDWVNQAPTPSPSPSFVAPVNPNKVQQAHMTAVNLAIGQVTTLDQTPPTFTGTPVSAALSETSLQITLGLDEAGTIWCMPVRSTFAEPSINEILQNNEYDVDCFTAACTVTMANLDAKTLPVAQANSHRYDIWCYAEDDNVYPQIPNGQKFVAGDVVTLSTQDTTPPVLTIVSAESPISSDIRIKVKMDEPGTVYCNSFQSSTAYGTPTFASVAGGGFQSYVGFPLLSPNSPVNTNVEVVVSGLNELTLYDTYCAAVDASTLPTVNEMTQASILNTFPAIGQLTTLDQSPPVFTELGAKGTTENNIQVTFKCNEACRAYCRVTRSDSGETSLSVNRILKADYYADQTGGAGLSATIDLARLENDVSLDLLDRGTLYDVYCWSRDEAVQYSCYAQAPSASCTTYPRNNYQDQTYVDTAFGGTPPATVTNGDSSPEKFSRLTEEVRTPDTTPPTITFVEAESTEESSITVTLQLDEPGTAYCKAYTTTQTVDAALYTALITAPVYKNTVTNWNNIYKNFDIKVSGLTMETKYFVYCAAEDDELVEGATTIDPAPVSNNEALPVLVEATGRFTLDLTPPIITVVSIASNSETTATVTLQLDEPGTAWCTAVRDQFTPPSINQIIAASFSSTVLTAATDFTVQVQAVSTMAMAAHPAKKAKMDNGAAGIGPMVTGGTVSWDRDGMPFFSMGAGTLRVPMAMHAAHRQKLCQVLRERAEIGRDAVIFLQGGKEASVYDTDTNWDFKQESNFQYLFGVKDWAHPTWDAACWQLAFREANPALESCTGSLVSDMEPDCFAALRVRDAHAVLFIPRMDNIYQAWCGPIKPPAWFEKAYSIEEVAHTDEIQQTLLDLGAKELLFVRGSPNRDSGLQLEEPTFDGKDTFQLNSKGSSALWDELNEIRSVKDEEELKLLQWTNDVSSEAHIETMRAVKGGQREHLAEATFKYKAALHGCFRVGYSCICGSGRRNAILHYGHAAEPNSELVEPGSLRLLDMGAEYHGYTADVTCSWPVSGRFSGPQRVVYEATPSLLSVCLGEHAEHVYVHVHAHAHAWNSCLCRHLKMKCK
ncbi:PEPD [Symbiodinium sp. CCMP2592]|nr:PEPD [Symbiodinium sp. CCMP2592]